MATIKPHNTSSSDNRKLAFVGGGLAAIVLIYFAVMFFLRPPQMGPDRAVLNGVDALFTAVNARDEKLLTQCEERLHALRASGKLPQPAADHLDGIIRTARQGRWRSAAESLYHFMLAQKGNA